MADFCVEFTKELPGWDEFGKSVRDTTVVKANSPIEAEQIFKNQPRNKYCYVDRVYEHKSRKSKDIFDPEW